jgi:hypothetical protein
MSNVFPQFVGRDTAMWGTFGKGGVEHCGGTCPLHQLKWKRLVDCDTEHLQAILRTQHQIVGHYYTDYIHSILKDRGVKPVKFSAEAANKLYYDLMRAKTHESKAD